ncbi:MAG: methyl-accepting chemotaxis protein [Lachnospiraceae bacterium]|nr:methyl-accepting chemotaxis protein [Candidatus Colinaster scatohippi]
MEEKREKSMKNVTLKVKREKSDVKFYKSIRFRLIGAFLVPIICIIALSVTSYTRAKTALISSYQNSTEQTVDMIGQYVSLIVSSEKENYKNFQTDADLKTYAARVGSDENHVSLKKQLNDKLRNQCVLDSKLTSVVFVMNNGDSFSISSDGLKGDDLTAYKQTVQGSETAADEYDWKVFGQDSDADSVLGVKEDSYAIRMTRVFSKDCIFVLNVDKTVVNDALQSLDPGAGGAVAIITADGREYYGTEEAAALSLNIADSDYYAKCVADETGAGSEMVMINGTEYLFIYNRLSMGNANVVALVPAATLIAGTKDIQRLSVVLTCIAIIISLLMSTIISNQMFGTIEYIRRQLKKVAGGNLTVRLSSKRADELGSLCESVNDTVRYVKDLIVNVNEVSEQLNDSAGYVQRSAETFIDTSNGISKIVDSLSEGTEKLDCGANDCMSQMDTLSGKIASVSANAAEIAKLTTETGETIELGISSVQGLTKSAESTTQITQSVISNVEELAVKSKSIDTIIDAINEIAEQTNLLSLNASIEAARAGQAGKGFAVVAQEIRSLADQCLVSARQISEITEEIVGKTAQVVEIARKAEDVVTEQGKAVELTTNSFRNIENQVDSLIDALGTISANVEEMDASKNQTLLAIEGIGSVSAQTTEGATGVNDSLESQKNAIDELSEAANMMHDRADKLAQLLGNFTI